MVQKTYQKSHHKTIFIFWIREKPDSERKIAHEMVPSPSEPSPIRRQKARSPSEGVVRRQILGKTGEDLLFGRRKLLLELVARKPSLTVTLRHTP